MAEWLRRGLQILARRFDSGSGLHVRAGLSIKWSLLSLVALPALGAVPAGAPVEIAVTNVRTAQGRIHVDLCTAAQFLHDCPLSGEAPAEAGTTVVTVRDVPPGRYAAQVFADTNSNGKVDRTLFGIPREGVGFSNDAPIRMAPPRFDDAAIDHGTAPQRITLRLRYFL